MTQKKFNRRKLIRYSRWLVKAAFLLFFIFPIVYLAGAPNHFVYSYFYDGISWPIAALPYGESVCVSWLFTYNQIGLGAWVVCPVGGLQTLLTGYVNFSYFLPLLGAFLLFLVPIFLLGNVFCSWVCPVGAIVDGFDKVVATYMRGIDAKREKRLQRSKAKEAAKKTNAAACLPCPFTRILNKMFGGTAANGVLVFSLVGSVVFRFPVFCSVCPIGVVSRGMFHLKAWTVLASVSQKILPIILELSVIPVIAVLLSLREKRYWCRKICPVGATLNLAGSVSPLLKPKVREEGCVMKKCPTTCDDYHLGYCGTCRQLDAKRCESVCPQGINLVEDGSLFRCTKCFECYIECEKDAVKIDVVGKSDAYTAFKRLLKRKPNAQDSPQKV